ncbi:MAG TPA: DUF2846 domain-containing protein [Candidatus Acidoferrales bacterium]
MKTLLLLFVLFVALAIPSLAHAQDQAALTAAGCGAKDIQFEVKTDKKSHPKGQPEPGKALVYVFNTITGISPGYPNSRVGVDGTWVGANHKKSYFYFSVAPGTHNLCTDRQLVTTFTAEPGQAYYFVIQFHRDGSIRLDTISPAEAELQIGKLAFSTFTQKPAK